MASTRLIVPDAARELVMAGVPPMSVVWQVRGDDGELFGSEGAASLVAPVLRFLCDLRGMTGTAQRRIGAVALARSGSPQACEQARHAAAAHLGAGRRTALGDLEEAVEGAGGLLLGGTAGGRGSG